MKNACFGEKAFMTAHDFIAAETLYRKHNVDQYE